VEAIRANPLPALPDALKPTKEKETLDMTKRLLRWRGFLMGVAIFLTFLPMSILHTDRVQWIFMRDLPAAITASVWIAAAACWVGFLYVRRRLQGAGL
jgi:hypothetical protein